MKSDILPSALPGLPTATTGPLAFLRGGLLAVLLAFSPLGGPAAAMAEPGDTLLAQALLARLDGTPPNSALAAPAVRKFYAERDYRPIWVSPQGPTKAAMTLAQILASADTQGLDPRRYGADGLDRRMRLDGEPTASAELELQLTEAMLRYTKELAAGTVDPMRLDGEHALQPEKPDPAAVLTGAARTDDIQEYLQGFAPQRAEYRRLLAALATYRQIAAAGGWSLLPDGPVLKPGAADARIRLLAERLTSTGDFAAGSVAPDGIYSEPLADAVRRFQARHGLNPDGAVGPDTLAALNVSVARRIQVLEINLERRRWMPHVLGDRYLFVNLADFTVRAVLSERTVFKARLVVGATHARTPVFAAQMTYLEFNPFWAVPHSIAVRELLPKIRKDPTWLTRNHFALLAGWQDGGTEVDPLTVDWRQISAARFPFHLRQASGEDNALGRVKFMFPNPFNVYLHDTPSKTLFSRPVRAASHGCMRVENPLVLAEVVLAMAGNDDWNREMIDSTVAAGVRRLVTLRQKLPVYVGYATAFVDAADNLHFRPDIYGRDKALGAAMSSSRGPASGQEPL